MKKGILDLIFIVLAAVLLILINQFGYLEKSIVYGLIPILMAYFLGQFVQKKYGKN